jgi:hypothetical protein
MPDNIGQKPNTNDFGFGNGEKSASQEKIVAEQDITIHTMPKRFLDFKPSSNKAKGIGLLIFIGGGIILILGIAFLYFYISNSELPFFNKKSDVIINNSVETNQNPATSAATQAEQAKEAENLVKSDGATSSLASNENISETTTAGSPVVATETPSIIDGDEQTDLASTTKKIKGFGPASSTVDYTYPDDTDKDGLVDLEEILFDSNVNIKDSDSDGYEDLAEILGLYNPSGNGGIIVNQNIEKYINSKYGYTLYYPYIWQAEKINGDDSIIFKLGNNQFIQIIAEQNALKKSLNDWYIENSGNAIINSSQILYKKGWEGIRSSDGLNVYLTKPNLNTILIMSYSLGTSNVANYKNVFDMMVNSLEIE